MKDSLWTDGHRPSLLSKLQYVCSATSIRQCMFCYMGTVRKLCGRTVFDYTGPQKHTGHLHALQPFLLMLPNADWAVSFLNFHSIQGSFLLIWQRRKLPCSFTPCSYSIKEAAPFLIQLFLWDFDSIHLMVKLARKQLSFHLLIFCIVRMNLAPDWTPLPQTIGCPRHFGGILSVNEMTSTDMEMEFNSSWTFKTWTGPLHMMK